VAAADTGAVAAGNVELAATDTGIEAVGGVAETTADAR
jgi:hypothetical protein